MNYENALNTCSKEKHIQFSKINDKENENGNISKYKNEINNNKNHNSNLKNEGSEYTEETNINNKLNINIKKKILDKIKYHKFKKEKEQNRVSYFCNIEKQNDNCSSSKLSRCSSVKIKLRDSLEKDYNKLKIDLLFGDESKKSKDLKNEINEFVLNKNNKKRNRLIKKNELIGKYEIYKNFQNKKKYFIILFLIGILLSTINLILSILLILYGNKEVLSLFIVLNIFVIFFYAIGIYFIERDHLYTFQIMSKLEAPEKIENSIHRNNIYLFIYFLLIAFNYYLTLVSGFTIFKNNIKIDIRSKGYDKKKWENLFQNKSFTEVLIEFERIYLAFMIFCWLSIILIFIIISFFIYLFNSYQFWKRIIQKIILIFGQISFLLINISCYCFQFRHITHLNEYTLNWVIIGLILVGIIGVIMSFFGFYIFYLENKKYIKIFSYLCIIFFIATAVFSAGAKALGLKFSDYKSASCNNIYKFISDDFLMKNNDCSSKYLFNSDNLKDIICPKERIMINWELTEKKNEENKEQIIFGCINQCCCLKIYCKLKTGFNYQEIIAFNQLILYIILFISSKYMEYKLDNILEEEIIEKFNIFLTSSFTLLIYLICLILIMFRPQTSKQSILNDIKVNGINNELTIINNDLKALLEDTPLQSNELWDKIIDNNFPSFNLSIINDFNDNNDSLFIFEYYDYYLYSNDLEIKSNNIYRSYMPYYDYNESFLSIYTNKINFKSKYNIMDSIFKYFRFNSDNSPQKNNSIFISLNLVYTINSSANITENLTKYDNKNYDFDENNLKISKELLLLNYNQSLNKSIINILNNKEIILNNNNINDYITYFYLKGNIYNDTGSSIIEVYYYDYIKEPIYSKKSEQNGEFTIGPFYLYENFIFNLIVNIFKIKQYINNSFEYDNNYNNYSAAIKIGGFGFEYNYPFPIIKNILLTKIINKKYSIKGYVFDNNNNKPLEEVFIKIYKGNKIIKSNDTIGKDDDTSDKNYIKKESTLKDGTFNIEIETNGQYTLIYVKDNYFIEIQNIIIDNSDIRVSNIGLIKLFNAGKIVVKLEWENNPPDLDLICRFEISNYINDNKTNYCYTFFGNRKCVSTSYLLDNKRGGKNGSEIIEIDVVAEYDYLFYIRKYLDISNNTAINENKINDVEDDLINNKDINNDLFNYYNENDELLKNSGSKLSLYANGLRMPFFTINIQNDNIKDYEYDYWAGFCLNGKKGLESLKIINKYYQNEPPKKICSEYF